MLAKIGMILLCTLFNAWVVIKSYPNTYNKKMLLDILAFMILKGCISIQDDPNACQNWHDSPWHVHNAWFLM